MWLCPIRLRSWNIIKRWKTYGLPCGRKKEIEKLALEDLLAVYGELNHGISSYNRREP